MAIRLPDAEEFELDIDQVERLSQNEFVSEVFVPHYQKGEHVAIMGPTQSGKTTLAYKLLDRLATPELPAVVLVMKPRDDVVKDWSRLSGFRVTQTWPPVINRAYKQKGGGFGKKQRGWVLWPKHSLSDIRRDDRMLARVFGVALTDCYKRGNRIVFADEIVGLSAELNLKDELKAIWSRGSGMGCGLWAASQRPFEAPLLMYNSSVHLMIFNDSDKRSRDRYKEIGGVDGDIVSRIVMRLRKHEFLYIGKFMAEDEVTPALAIVSAN